MFFLSNVVGINRGLGKSRSKLQFDWFIYNDRKIFFFFFHCWLLHKCFAKYGYLVRACTLRMWSKVFVFVVIFQAFSFSFALNAFVQKKVCKLSNDTRQIFDGRLSYKIQSKQELCVSKTSANISPFQFSCFAHFFHLIFSSTFHLVSSSNFITRSPVC